MLPGLASSGPYPTVVEYSGYDPSNPDNTTFGQLLNTLGFAYVGVNMRGTGCSGGSFRLFEQKQLDDGYDVADYRSVHPWFGKLEDFRQFVREAHRRGLKVITELVINHTSDQHPWFINSRSSRTARGVTMIGRRDNVARAREGFREEDRLCSTAVEPVRKQNQR